MAILQTNQPDPNLRIFRLAPNGRDLSEIPRPIWQQMINRERPLEPANGSVKVLLMRLRSGGAMPSTGVQREQPACEQPACEQIDALRLQTDEFGFLLTWDATGVSGTPTGTPSVHLVDARYLFLQRYIAHRHCWQPEPALLTQALEQLAQHPVY